MAETKVNRVYFVAVRIFFILLFGLLLYLQPYLIYDEGYQESHLYPGKGNFSFVNYLFLYPTEVCMPIGLVLAIPGLIFKKKIGWIAAFSIIVCMSVEILYNKLTWQALPWWGFFSGLFIMLVQLSTDFGIHRKHLLWSALLITGYAGLVIIEKSGGFISSKAF